MHNQRDGTRRAETADVAPPGLSEDRLYRALSATRRRRLLYALLHADERTVEELATVLAGWTATETGEMTTADERETIALELTHAHLPLLEEAGLVAYDRERGVVRAGPLDDAVADLIRRGIESERQ